MADRDSRAAELNDTGKASYRAVRVKVCGLTSVDEARACAALGVDWIGLNFHPPSPRYVDPRRASEIAAALPPEVSAVGVFVNRPPDEISDVAERVGLALVQLHGDEPPEHLRSLLHLRVVKAFRLDCGSAWERVSAYIACTHSIGAKLEAVLIDAYIPGIPGGTGQLVADDVFRHVPPLPPLILSGGLTPENVARRAAQVMPWMVDVASGVESAPGRKDLSKVAEFIAAARGARPERQFE
jgi:phosphoribosylanthranilate isomerase